MTAISEAEREKAAHWFAALREEILSAFEALEREVDAPGQPAAFTRRPTQRPGGGGGEMAVMKGGRVFEKVGVNFSAVFGTLSPRAQGAMAARGVPGLEKDPRFWASGISLVAHMQNPHAPAVHMNTRLFWTPGAWWFGGGADLNPCIEYGEDTVHFHGEMAKACEGFEPGLYDRLKAWADEYFFIPHRGRARGVGGIFYDDRNSGGFAADFTLTQQVGRAFLPAFLPLARRRAGQPFTEAERDIQLRHRGLYAEYNLVYDRGTKFGLETGHDPEAVLMSLPPLAKWV